MHILHIYVKSCIFTINYTSIYILNILFVYIGDAQPVINQPDCLGPKSHGHTGTRQESNPRHNVSRAGALPLEQLVPNTYITCISRILHTHHVTYNNTIFLTLQKRLSGVWPLCPLLKIMMRMRQSQQELGSRVLHLKTVLVGRPSFTIQYLKKPITCTEILQTLTSVQKVN